jgi:peptidoglycan/LPS O-acetylase OafA/YrhL
LGLRERALSNRTFDDYAQTQLTPIEQPKSESANRRMPDLDGLRAVAISLVLLEHFATILMPTRLTYNLAHFGWIGVDLFFVISGFLIGGILLDHRRANNYYRVFYLRRFLRIVPLYAVLLLPMLGVLVLGLQSRLSGHGLAGLGWGTMILYLCFQQNLGNGLFFLTPGYMGPAWSLAIEEQFYLLLPPLVRHLNKKQLLKLVIIAIVLAPLIRAALFLLPFDNPGKPGAIAGMLLPCRWDALLAGVLVAYGVREVQFQDWISKRLKPLRTLCLLLGSGVLGLALSGLPPHVPLIAIGGYSWIAAFFACTLLLTRISPQGLVHYGLCRPALKPLATISYGLYLIQGPTMAVRQSILVERLGWPDTGWGAVGVNLLTLGVTVLVAAISWRWFESRLIRLGHNHSYNDSERITS